MWCYGSVIGNCTLEYALHAPVFSFPLPPSPPRMFVSIVLLGTYHGLILLPVLLSYYGPDKLAKKNAVAVDFLNRAIGDLGEKEHGQERSP